MGIRIHLVFFLHITTAPDNTNNLLALAFGILIVPIVTGSLWIMANMNHISSATKGVRVSDRRGLTVPKTPA